MSKELIGDIKAISLGGVVVGVILSAIIALACGIVHAIHNYRDEAAMVALFLASTVILCYAVGFAWCIGKAILEKKVMKSRGL